MFCRLGCTNSLTLLFTSDVRCTVITKDFLTQQFISWYGNLSMPNVGHSILSVLFLSTLLLIFGCFYVIFKNVAANSVCYHFLRWSDKCSLHNISIKCTNLVQMYFPNSNFLLFSCSRTVVFKKFRSLPIVHECTASCISRSKNCQLLVQMYFFPVNLSCPTAKTLRNKNTSLSRHSTCGNSAAN